MIDSMVALKEGCPPWRDPNYHPVVVRAWDCFDLAPIVGPFGM